MTAITSNLNGTSQELWASVEQKEKARKIIKQKTLLATSLSFIPIPILDTFGITSIQICMIQDIAEVYLKIAEFHLRDKNHSEGLETLQKALNSAGRNIQISNAQLNPEPNEVFSKRQLLQLLDIKLQLLQIAHTKTNDEKYINAAINTNKDILGTFDLLKKEFESKLDKQFLAETAYPIFHRMLAITYEAFKENSTSDLFELALNISEKNKDFLLLEALRNANATQYGNVPNEIIEKEAQIQMFF